MTTERTQTNGITTQNDIADALLFLAQFLPAGPIKDFVIELAEWFENLSQNEAFKAQCEAESGIHIPESLINGECAAKIGAEIRSIVSAALMDTVGKLPALLEMALGCFMGADPQPAKGKKASGEAQASQQISINFACLFQAGMTYFQTRDITKTVTAFLTCQFGSGGGGGTGGASGYLGNAAKRC